MPMNSYKKHLINSKISIKEALARLDILAEDAVLFIVDEQFKLVGSLTDGDVRRGLLKGFGLNDSVDQIMYQSPRFINKEEWNVNKLIEYRQNNFKIIPVVDSMGSLVNIINFRNTNSYLPVDAVIMAGGRGDRLKPLTDTIPKPLLKIGEKPIIEHNLDHLHKYGIENFWITLKYLGEKIEKYLGTGEEKEISIQYVYETKPLGTIGAVSKINNFKHDFILIVNSDLLTNIDYESFFLDFVSQKADFSVATIPYRINVPYAVLETSNGHVVSFKEKPTYTFYSNGGIYLIKREHIANIPHDTHFDATDLMEKMLTSNKKIISFPVEAYWLDIGKQEDYDKAQNDIKQIKF